MNKIMAKVIWGLMLCLVACTAICQSNAEFAILVSQPGPCDDLGSVSITNVNPQGNKVYDLEYYKYTKVGADVVPTSERYYKDISGYLKIAKNIADYLMNHPNKT
jgi:hypothetical protein